MTTVDGTAAGDSRSPDHVTILLVDDDETWARVTSRLLAGHNDGFEVTTAASLAAGREAFDRLDPDCVVCDYQLGDGTGLALLESVRAADSDRPFLLVTGRGSESVASEAINQGVTDYIRKDQDDDEASVLASRIRNAVTSYRTERALERERQSKTALLDILTGAASERELSQQFCARLVDQRGYACAWLGRDRGSTETVPQAVAGRESYVEAIHDPGKPLPAGEPARLALDRDESVLARLDADGSDAGAARAEWEPLATGHGFEGAIAVPIRHDGVRFGVLAVYTDDAVLDEGERRAIEEYAETVGYALTNAERKRSLIAPRPVSVRVHIDIDAVPLGGLVDAVADDEAIELVSTVPRDDGTTLYVTEIDGVAPGTIEHAVMDTDGLRAATRDDSTPPLQCEVVVTEPTPEERLATHGVGVEETALGGGTVTLSLSLPDDGTVSTVQEVLTTAFGDAEVSTIRTGRARDAPTTDCEFLTAMTERQREVLRHALDVGYFERPRGTSATELADHFGISRATLSQHLRTAQRKVFSRLFYDHDAE